MADKWTNLRYEEEELKPFIEPPKDCTDSSRIDKSSAIHCFVNSSFLSMKYLLLIVIYIKCSLNLKAVFFKNRFNIIYGLFSKRSQNLIETEQI